MKKLFFTFLLCFALSVQAFGGLAFATDSTDRLNCGSASNLDNISAGTVATWLNVTTLGATNFGAVASKSNTAYTVFKEWDITDATNSGRPWMEIDRATTNLECRSTQIPATGQPIFVAYTWNTAGTNTDQHIYYGTLTTNVAETSYSLQQVGTGTVQDDSAESWGIGNMAGGTASAGGGVRTIYWVGVWNRQLSLAEIQAQQFHPHNTGSNENVLMVNLGWNGTGTQPDVTGNGNNCTVTGATQGSHYPTGGIFGMLDIPKLKWTA